MGFVKPKVPSYFLRTEESLLFSAYAIKHISGRIVIL